MDVKNKLFLYNYKNSCKTKKFVICLKRARDRSVNHAPLGGYCNV